MRRKHAARLHRTTGEAHLVRSGRAKQPGDGDHCDARQATCNVQRATCDMRLEYAFSIDARHHGAGNVRFAWHPRSAFVASTGSSKVVHVCDRRGVLTHQVVLPAQGCAWFRARCRAAAADTLALQHVQRAGVGCRWLHAGGGAGGVGHDCAVGLGEQLDAILGYRREGAAAAELGSTGVQAGHWRRQRRTVCVRPHCGQSAGEAVALPRPGAVRSVDNGRAAHGGVQLSHSVPAASTARLRCPSAHPRAPVQLYLYSALGEVEATLPLPRDARSILVCARAAARRPVVHRSLNAPHAPSPRSHHARASDNRHRSSQQR